MIRWLRRGRYDLVEVADVIIALIGFAVTNSALTNANASNHGHHSTGLLVLTQDGRIAKQLIGESSGIEKEYLVRVEGTLPAAGLAQLNFGLSLDGAPLKRAEVKWQNDDQLRFVLREGKKRQIRRMCELVGLKVTGLKRVRIGKVLLGDLPQGQWRYLRSDERF